jgi:hypothetical protein
MKMKPSYLLGVSVLAVLGGCGGGDVNLGVSTTDNSVSSGGGGNGGGANPCAQYTTAGNVVRQGSWDGTNCTYGADFVGVTNPLTVNVTIPSITGVHIFEDSLFVGQDVSTGAPPAGGTGPTLTIAAGNRLAFSESADYLLINRGASIVAQGTAAKPITFTGYEDAVLGTAGPEETQLWGGIVINGNGETNNCTADQRAANACHVQAEGQPSFYGGNNNAESSGVLRYVVIKHAGFEVVDGNELNGLTLNAVGSGTVIENLELYATQDDGVEFFGGAVNISNLVALYVGDDSIDFSDGWSGTIDNALVIHSRTASNHCVEGDNVNASRTQVGTSFDLTPASSPTIRNLTCVTSRSPVATKGQSRGAIIRQGARVRIEDSIFFGGYGDLANPAVTGSRCFEFGSAAGETSATHAASGLSTMNSTIVACAAPTSGNIASGVSTVEWVRGTAPYTFNVGNNVITTPNAGTVRVLEPSSFYTAPTLDNGAGPIAPLPNGRTYGAVLRASDWTAGWTYGLHSTNRGQPLFFE